MDRLVEQIKELNKALTKLNEDLLKIEQELNRRSNNDTERNIK